MIEIKKSKLKKWKSSFFLLQFGSYWNDWKNVLNIFRCIVKCEPWRSYTQKAYFRPFGVDQIQIFLLDYKFTNHENAYKI